MTRDDDWVQVAMVNDAVVVEVLVQIHRASRSRRIKSGESESLGLDWSVRQPRSKPLSVNSNNNNKKSGSGSGSRSSPTTPLSWSGATSFSADELCSRPQAPLRSKVSVGIGTRTRLLSSKSKAPKKKKKKKSIDELREEENLLNKERRHLKKELVALRMDIEKQRGINENLKRLKLAVEVETTTAAATTTTSFSQNVCAGSHRMNNSFPFLPDLNIACGGSGEPAVNRCRCRVVSIDSSLT